MSALYYESSFAHHGIKGQKWGIRRYQNKDGTLTPRGQKRYQKQMEKIIRAENQERRRIALEQTKIKEARKTEQAKLKLQKEKEGLTQDKNALKAKSNNTLDKSKTEIPKRKLVSEMTDDELRAMINRIDLERKLNALNNPSKDSTFGKWFASVAQEAGKSLITNVATQAGQNLGKKMFASDSTNKNKSGK